jgi:hypothetical protein
MHGSSFGRGTMTGKKIIISTGGEETSIGFLLPFFV